MNEPFPPTALRRRHAQTVRDSSSSNKIDYVIVVKTFLNPEGRQNRITGSKVMASFESNFLMKCYIITGLKKIWSVLVSI